jgi:hypothetical protein
MARRRREEHGNRERWLVSYADFITLLFAFFTTLYAISVVDAVKAKKLVHSIRESFGEGVLEMNHPSLLDGESGQPVELGTGTAGLREGGGEEALEHLAEQLEKLPLPEGVGDGVSFRLTERGLVITLAASLFFPSGGKGPHRGPYRQSSPEGGAAPHELAPLCGTGRRGAARACRGRDPRAPSERRRLRKRTADRVEYHRGRTAPEPAGRDRHPPRPHPAPTPAPLARKDSLR